MHLSQALIDGFQPLADLSEAGIQLFIQAFRQALVHGFPHFSQLTLILQTEGVDLLLLVTGGEQYLPLHAFQQGGLILTHLRHGGEQILIRGLQGSNGFIPLGIEFIEQLTAENGKVVFLPEAVFLLAVRQGSLPDQQDDQEHQAGKEKVELCGHAYGISLLPSSALRRVTSSVYSRSPPTGTPWAIRVQRIFIGCRRRAI